MAIVRDLEGNYYEINETVLEANKVCFKTKNEVSTRQGKLLFGIENYQLAAHLLPEPVPQEDPQPSEKNNHHLRFGRKERDEWLNACLSQLPDGSRILDAGAGRLRMKAFCKHLNYVSQDLNAYDGRGDGTGQQHPDWKNAEVDIVSDITAIPQPDASFDAILCVAVIEHIPDPVAAIREFNRLLKKGGKLILTAPFSSMTHFAPYHYYSGFTKYFYREHLPACGFKICSLEQNGNYFSYLRDQLQQLMEQVEKHSHTLPTGSEMMATHAIMEALHRYTQNDHTSSELLHFGCQVVAEKQQTS